MANLDLIVIGAGPAGYVGAIRAAQLGAKVAVFEERDVGGTCLNRGCIPSKALIHSAHLLDEAASGRRFGIKFADPEVDLDGVRKHAQRCVKGLVSGVEALFKANKVLSVKGRARITGADEVTVTSPAGKEKAISAKQILVATGSEPLVLPIPGADGEGVFTSDDAVGLPGPYPRLAIIGAGAIGCEFAYVYSRFGAEVTVIEMLDRIVPTEDPDATEVLARSFKQAGIKVELGAKCTAIEHTDAGKRLLFEQGGEEKAMEADGILMAAGRRALTADIGLEEVGVAMERGRITVDEALRTSVDSIFAAGDCLRGIGLAHQASHEAIAAVETMFGDGGHINYDAVPAAIYTYPQIASVGIREHEAAARGIDVEVGVFPFAAVGKAAAIGEREGMVKLVADAKTGQLIGASAAGPDVTELIAEITLAIQMGCTATDVAETIHTHPTLAEAVGEAALAVLGRAIHLP
jgi:dihydrolipoamide dehydrogenase